MEPLNDATLLRRLGLIFGWPHVLDLWRSEFLEMLELTVNLDLPGHKALQSRLVACA